ncbi:Coproporphyrinogen-III oxidase [Fusarium torreyae]|uniref:coproporphyrinogen oxidase n=1 Tax=Fusarium torreyae TaxID=1237075 RepID=A0A9W8VFT2_9HYPO|nr:Coproporphyrinogen-III oxidase [Fusarium torreyae]
MAAEAEHFYTKHRGGARGIGDIFSDDLNETERDRENTFSFVQDCLKVFLPSYIPIIEKRKDMPYVNAKKHWQQRRGKYVEFNLVHDRGTRLIRDTSTIRRPNPLSTIGFDSSIGPGGNLPLSVSNLVTLGGDVLKKSAPEAKDADDKSAGSCRYFC